MEEAFLSYGLSKAGLSGESIERTNEKTKMQRFVAFYGCCPETCTKIFLALKESDTFEGTVSMRHLFLGLLWLKAYMTVPILAGIFGISESTVRKNTCKYVRAIQSLKTSKVRNCCHG